MNYKIEIHVSAYKTLCALPKNTRDQIRHAIRHLTNNPRPRKAIKLTNHQD